MQTNTQDVIRSIFDASNAGTIHFGQVIGRLASVQVESYHVDYRAGRTTYFLAEDETVDLHFEQPDQGVGAAFDAEAMRAAIRGAQQVRVKYPEFKRLSQQAGCVGYTVWIAGRHVTYLGRKGETHVERFPD